MLEFIMLLGTDIHIRDSSSNVTYLILSHRTCKILSWRSKFEFFQIYDNMSHTYLLNNKHKTRMFLVLLSSGIIL